MVVVCAYLGSTEIPSNSSTISRNTDAKWFLPTENEWYKAAFHKNDGVSGNYFRYPTSSDTNPAPEAPPGGSNSANYGFRVGDFTPGGAYVNTTSPYGAFDMAGNVIEWNESIVDGGRGWRGGSIDEISNILLSSYRWRGAPSGGYVTLGFRVATIVPEPRSWMLGATAALVSLALMRFGGIKPRGRC